MKPSRERLIIILGSFVLLIGTIYILTSFVYPAFLEIQSLRAERQARIDLLHTQEDAEAKIGELTRQYEGLATTEEAFSQILPVGPEVPSLLNQIHGIARNNSLSIESLSFQYQPIRPTSEAIVQAVGVLRTTISLNGRYENLKVFMAQLETNARIIDLNSLRIEGGAVPRRDTFDYNLVVDSYYQVE